MRVSIIQASLVWENPNENRAKLGEHLAALKGHTDLVVLPEMFTTGFSMNMSVLAETMEGPTIQWLRKNAGEMHAAIVGSFICVEAGRFYNRLVFMHPDGHFEYYDKKHLFGLSGETNYYTAGEKQLLVSYKGWRIRPLICYDLRFPAWSRNLKIGKNKPYDLLIYVANWPIPRIAQWDALLTARAIENQSFTIGVNIYGVDGNGLEYSGNSTIIDYSGGEVCRISEQENIVTAELNLSTQQEYRKQLPFLQDADVFRLQ